MVHHELDVAVALDQHAAGGDVIDTYLSATEDVIVESEEQQLAEVRWLLGDGELSPGVLGGDVDTGMPVGPDAGSVIHRADHHRSLGGGDERARVGGQLHRFGGEITNLRGGRLRCR